MGKNLVDIHDSLLKRRTFGFFDDFTDFTSTARWTTVGTAAPTILSTGTAGQAVLTSGDASANHGSGMATTASLFLIQANKPMIAECLINWTEASTNKAQIGFGFCDAVTLTKPMADTTGAPNTSFSGAIIMKQLGTLTWQTVSSISTTQTITAVDSNVAASGGATTWYRLRVEISPISSTIAEVAYFIDPNAAGPGSNAVTSGAAELQARDNTTRKNLIKDFITYTGAAQMQAFLLVKNGTTAQETVNADYYAVELLR